VPIGRPLAVEAETGGDLSPFFGGLQQGILRRFLAAEGGCRDNVRIIAQIEGQPLNW